MLFCDLIDLDSSFASGHTDQNFIVVCEVFIERYEGESKDLPKSIARWKEENLVEGSEMLTDGMVESVRRDH